MESYYIPKRFFALLILLMVFPACAQMKTGASSQTSIQETAKKPVQVKRPQATGDHQKTIDAYKSEHAKRPSDQSLTKEYVNSLEEMEDTADKEFEKENYTSACKTYNILLKNYPAFKPFAGMLSFNNAKLNKKLTDCKTVLSRKGFQEYREGNLSEAIALWQGYLAVDPHNADIRKAVNTATLQQKNLEKKQ